MKERRSVYGEDNLAAQAISEAYEDLDTDSAQQIVDALAEPLRAVHKCASKTQLQTLCVQLTVQNMAQQVQLKKLRAAQRTITKVG